MPAKAYELFENLSKFYDADHEVVYRLKCYELVVRGSRSLRDHEQGPGLWPMVDGVKMLFGYTYDVDPWDDGVRVDWCVETKGSARWAQECEYFATYVEAADYLCEHLESFEAVEDTDNE